MADPDLATGLTPHETRIVEALVGVVDYASRLLISARPGSEYQRAKAYEMRDRLDRLIAVLDQGLVPHNRAEAVTAQLVGEAGRYTLGQLLVQSGHLGGTA